MNENIVKPKKRFRFIRFAFKLFVLTFVAYGVYAHYDDIVDNVKYRLKDPGEKVLSANVSENELIYTFHDEMFGDAYLYAGDETRYGFRHILARHTNDYFSNYDDKNFVTLFDDEVTGGDIILGIRNFYNNCVDVGSYNRNPLENTTYVGFSEINGEKIKCLLVIRNSDNVIVTFYPFNLRREEEILSEKEEERELEIERLIELREQEFEQELEEKKREIEQQVRDEMAQDASRYYYD